MASDLLNHPLRIYLCRPEAGTGITSNCHAIGTILRNTPCVESLAVRIRGDEPAFVIRLVCDGWLVMDPP